MWHHIAPCPDDEARFDLILERSIPVIVLNREAVRRRLKNDRFCDIAVPTGEVLWQ